MGRDGDVKILKPIPFTLIFVFIFYFLYLFFSFIILKLIYFIKNKNIMNFYKLFIKKNSIFFEEILIIIIIIDIKL